MPQEGCNNFRTNGYIVQKTTTKVIRSEPWATCIEDQPSEMLSFVSEEKIREAYLLHTHRGKRMASKHTVVNVLA